MEFACRNLGKAPVRLITPTKATDLARVTIVFVMVFRDAFYLVREISK